MFALLLTLSFTSAALAKVQYRYNEGRNLNINWILKAARSYGEEEKFNATVPVLPPLPADHQRLLTCYYSYSPGTPSTPQIADVDPDLCTHLILVGIITLDPTTWTLMSQFNASELRQFQTLKKKNTKLKISLCIGSEVENLISNQTKMDRFGTDTANFMAENKFDGLDIDWEFPSNEEEKQGFTALLKTIKAHFLTRNSSLLLTAAVGNAVTIMDTAYDIPEINKYLDYINLMNYDFHQFHWYTPFVGFNAPLFKLRAEIWILATVNTAAASFEWYRRGMDHWKILVGIPTYGRGYSLLLPFLHFPYAPATGVSKHGTFIDYATTCDLLQHHDYDRVWNDEAKVPYCHKGRDWISFDDQESVTLKERVFQAEWLRQENFGGGMVWQVSDDDWQGRCGTEAGRYPLIKAIRDAIFG